MIWSNYFLYKMLVLNISRDLGSSAGLFENKSMKAELLILNTRVRLLITGDTVLCYVRTLSADQPIRCYTLMLCWMKDAGGWSSQGISREGVSWCTGHNPSATVRVKGAHDLGLGPVPAFCSVHVGEDWVVAAWSREAINTGFSWKVFMRERKKIKKRQHSKGRKSWNRSG